MKKILLGIVGIIILAVLYFCLWPIDLEPVPYNAPKNPGFIGDFAPNNELENAEKLLSGFGIGPEDIALGPDSMFYSGYADGKIVRFSSDGQFKEIFANTDGRPLGMQFDSSKNLIVADEYKGLLSIDSTGQISVLTTEVDGTTIFYADDLDIASNGVIYFTDATQRNRDIIHEFMEMQPTGRLLSYNPATKETKVELEGLRFANGVAIGPNEEYVLVNQTFGFVINKYWLKGPQKGQSEVFTDRLPGFPDNINYNDDGIFWLAIPNKRPQKEVEEMYDKPFLRKVTLRMPESVYRGLEPPPFGMVLGLDLEGNVKYNFQDTTGGFYYITSATEYNGSLWLGSLKMDGLGKLDISKL